MPTVKLYYNTINAVPASTDPTHYRIFNVDFVDDREIEELKNKTILIDESVVWDVVGIRRKLIFFLRTIDIKNNIDFLNSYFNAAYIWAVVPDAGYFFNIGTPASPVPVPVYSSSKAINVSVPGLNKGGVELITADVYPRPTAPTLSSGVVTASSVTVVFSGVSLKQNIYRAGSPGGVLSYVNSDTDNYVLDSGLNPSTTYYYKGTVVTIGGESELSTELSIATGAS